MSAAAAVAVVVNSSMSQALPGLQLGVDSTSLGEAKICPRKYKYAILDGWQPRDESVHLTFGLLVHRARELYDHQRCQGIEHEEALDFVLADAMRATWNKQLDRPWISGHPQKNRASLIRTIVWYLDQFKDDPLETVRLANGKPAVELSFAFDTGFAASTGEHFLLCGHLDRLARMGEGTYVVDVKTTSHSLGSHYFSRFSPDNQFSLYTLASKIVFKEPALGLVLDAIQVGTDFIRCQRHLVPRPPAVVDEWWSELPYWLELMNRWAWEERWPQNDKACGLFGGCQFREVCTRAPSAREAWLKANFTKRVWDPLQKRGDV